MKVTLLARTPDAERLVASAGRGCYSAKPSSEIIKTMSDEETERTIGLIHGSVLEHAVFTFCIEGISRACSHQLVRHRLASFSQQSQRYVDVHRTWEHLVIPPTVKEVIDDEDCLGDSRSDDHMANAIETFKDALDDLIKEMDAHDIPSEDIRYFVPQGTMTDITVTMNARELLHFFSLRCCNRAQWEIREVANRMLEICKGECPTLFKDAGASCHHGGCTEHRPCGKVSL